MKNETKKKKKKNLKKKKRLQIPLQEGGHLLPRLPIKLPTLRHAPRVASPASRHQGRRRHESRGLWLLLIPTAELLRKMLTLKLPISRRILSLFNSVFLLLFVCCCFGLCFVLLSRLFDNNLPSCHRKCLCHYYVYR